MWTETTSSGKTRAVERFTDLQGNTRKVSVMIDKTTRKALKEADNALREKIREILDEQQRILDEQDINKTTLREMCKNYLKDKEKNVKASSYCSIKSEIKKLQEIFDADMFVTDYTALYINKTLQKYADNPKYYNYLVAAIKKLFRWGYEFEYLESISFLDKVKKRKDNRKVRIQDKYLEKEQLQKLIVCMFNKRQYSLLTEFLALSGVRIGEAIALTMDDITGDYIVINKTYMVQVYQTSDSPKTFSSNREIFIQKELRECINKIEKYRKEQMIKTGVRTDLLFFNKAGYEIDYRAYCAYLVRISKKAIGQRVTPHYLRHTHVSLLAEQGESLETIAQRLGHGNPKVTREVYFHVTKLARDKNNEHFNDIRLLS